VLNWTSIPRQEMNGVIVVLNISFVMAQTSSRLIPADFRRSWSLRADVSEANGD
jgi:hypothetical protein